MDCKLLWLRRVDIYTLEMIEPEEIEEIRHKTSKITCPELI